MSAPSSSAQSEGGAQPPQGMVVYRQSLPESITLPRLTLPPTGQRAFTQADLQPQWQHSPPLPQSQWQSHPQHAPQSYMPQAQPHVQPHPSPLPMGYDGGYTVQQPVMQPPQPYLSYRLPHPPSYYKRKYKLLKRSTKSLAYQNAALSDEIDRLNTKITQVTDEQRVLLRRVLLRERTRKKKDTVKKTKLKITIAGMVVE